MKCINCGRYGIVKTGKHFCWAKEEVIENPYEEIECEYIFKDGVEYEN